MAIKKPLQRFRGVAPNCKFGDAAPKAQRVWTAQPLNCKLLYGTAPSGCKRVCGAAAPGRSKFFSMEGVAAAQPPSSVQNCKHT